MGEQGAAHAVVPLGWCGHRGCRHANLGRPACRHQRPSWPQIATERLGQVRRGLDGTLLPAVVQALPHLRAHRPASACRATLSSAAKRFTQACRCAARGPRAAAPWPRHPAAAAAAAVLGAGWAGPCCRGRRRQRLRARRHSQPCAVRAVGGTGMRLFFCATQPVPMLAEHARSPTLPPPASALQRRPGPDAVPQPGRTDRLLGAAAGQRQPARHAAHPQRCRLAGLPAGTGGLEGGWAGVGRPRRLCCCTACSRGRSAGLLSTCLPHLPDPLFTPLLICRA